MSHLAEQLSIQAALDAATSPKTSNAVVRCCDPARHLQIGIFFDGTSNYNKFDIIQRKMDIAWDTNERPSKETEGREKLQAARAAEKEAAERERNCRETVAALETTKNNLDEQAAELAKQEYALDLAREGAMRQGDTGEIEYLSSQKENTRARWRKTHLQAVMYKQQLEEAKKEAALAGAEKRRCSNLRYALEEQAMPASPGESGLTNVAKLHDLYSEKPNKDQHKIYIRGVGAVLEATTQAEYTALGCGLGLGREGEEARIKEACARLREILGELQPEFRMCPPESVTIDIFGFSRGAALARHFVNMVLEGLPDFSKPVEPAEQHDPLGGLRSVSPYTQTARMEFKYSALPNVKIRFVGLFDTFVGLFDTVGSFYFPGNPDEGRFKTHLPAGCADKVVHLVAADERRKNFRYTDVTGAGEEITMAGVHSDIGGGYKLVENCLLLIDKEAYAVPHAINPESRQKIAAEGSILQRAKARGLCKDGVLVPGLFLKHCIENPGSTLSEGHICGLFRIKRTENRYATVPLHIMYNKAVEAKVPFSDIIDTKPEPDYVVPAELQGYIASPPAQLEFQQWDTYQHVSAVELSRKVPHDKPVLCRYPYRFDETLGMKLDSMPEGMRNFFPNAEFPHRAPLTSLLKKSTFHALEQINFEMLRIS